ncbi:hypothetical protein ACT7C1_34605 [Bacillus paranthracis]
MASNSQPFDDSELLQSFSISNKRRNSALTIIYIEIIVLTFPALKKSKAKFISGIADVQECGVPSPLLQ